MLKSYKTIFFDAGGTLLHPHPSVGEIYCEVAARYGASLKAKELDVLFRQAWLKRDGLSSLASHSNEKIEREWWRGLVFEVIESVGGIRDFETFFDELYRIFGSPEVWRLYPDVREVLETLKAQGKKLAVISNWDSRLFKIVHGLDLERYFDFVLISAVFGASKPSPKIFQEALRQTGADPKDAVHIGDSIEDDIHGALKAGISAVLIDRHPEARPAEYQPVIRDLRELL